MKTNDIFLGNSQEKLFNLEYEFHINKLKLYFLEYQQSRLNFTSEYPEKINDDIFSNELEERYRTGVDNLRKFVDSNFNLFDAKNCSSLFCIPTQSISEDERFIHRIWMGRSLPQTAREAVFQWGEALKETKFNSDLEYICILWVWNEEQLQDDPLFTPTGGIGKYTVGRYSIENHVLHVNSLHELAIDLAADNFNLINELHAKKYFATLSDYFRFLILIKFGGVYMDVDTIPYKSATIFLTKPEIPDYVHFKTSGDSGKVQQYHVSWMNLFLDETGMVVARKDDPSLKIILEQINNNYKKIVEDIPEKNSDFELILFDDFYKEWKSHIGCTFLSYADFTECHSVLYDGKKENVICGIRGMRLLVDVITNIKIPLSLEEQRSYDKCIDGLDKLDWMLDNPFKLESVADIFYINEVPRMAYAPQIRSDIEHYHYYSVLSDDEKLDRVNSLFGKYLIENNSNQIKSGIFWRKTKGGKQNKNPDSIASAYSDSGFSKKTEISSSNISIISSDPINLVPGHLVGEEHKNSMAELLFSTSYLEYCSFSNVLNLNFVALQRIQNIDQYIDHVNGVYDSDNNFIGFFTAGTIEDFNKIQAVSYYRDEMKAIDDAYDKFVLKNSYSTDYFVSSLAIESKYRGKGLFNQIFKEIENMARQKGSRRIILTVWEQSEALKIYLKKGFKVADTFDYAFSLFFDKLYFLEYEIFDTVAVRKAARM